MYELTLILSLMIGGATAEMEVNTQFTSLEECNQEGADLAKKLNTTDLKVM